MNEKPKIKREKSGLLFSKIKKLLLNIKMIKHYYFKILVKLIRKPKPMQIKILRNGYQIFGYERNKMADPARFSEME